MAESSREFNRVSEGDLTARGDAAYTAPDKKSVGELLSSEGKEGEDEAMQRYKAQLLGAAASGGGVAADLPFPAEEGVGVVM